MIATRRESNGLSAAVDKKSAIGFLGVSNDDQAPHLPRMGGSSLNFCNTALSAI
jgi:hypothetical protein